MGEIKILSLCYSCRSRREMPGDCHIQCANPPLVQGRINSGGDDIHERMIKAVEKIKTEKNILIVVRCVWSGSGMFPLSFDANTVYGCGNYEEGKPDVKEADSMGVLAAVANARYPG